MAAGKQKQYGENCVVKQLTNKVLLDIHQRMVRIRIFEEEAGKLMEAGKIPGALHLYVGQEAVARANRARERADGRRRPRDVQAHGRKGKPRR